MAVPTTFIEIAWDSGFSTPEGSRTWTDVSDYGEFTETSGAEIKYGRDDELSQPDPNSLSLTLDNRDGRFTPAKASSPYYPNVKKGKPIRVSVRYADEGSGNLLTANQASMETSSADWATNTAFGTYTAASSVVNSSAQAFNGSKSTLVTWATTGIGSWVGTLITGLSVGATYIASTYVYVPAGSPDPRLEVLFTSYVSARTSTKNSWVRLSTTFVATASTARVGVQVASATAGQTLYIDAAQVDQGDTLGTFTTSAPPTRVRFTGYIDEWPLVWPGATAGAATVSITATSRRARLGQTAPLTSAIRAAYLATTPDAYWPMDEDADVVLASNGQQVFRDITNPILEGRRETQLLGAFSATTALMPVVRDETDGPTDEESLVRFPRYTDSALLFTYPHQVGSGSSFSINTAGEATVECVARIVSSVSTQNITTLITLASIDFYQRFSFVVSSDGDGDPAHSGLGPLVEYFNSSMTLVPTTVGSLYSPANYAKAIDGEIHHYAMTLTSANTVNAYFDGVLIFSDTLTGGYTFDQRLTKIALGGDTYNSTAWIGHAAVHNRALTGPEIATRAAAATAASETLDERVKRIAGRIGVPSAEVDVEASNAGKLGSQPEKDRSAIEVLDEAAASSAGILYDTRAGHLAMQSRNHRYNQTAAFTLSAALHEIEGDLTPVDDYRYMANTIEVARVTDDATPVVLTDAASVAAHGVRSKTLTVVAASDEEAIAAGQDQLYRYADPAPRVNTISMDVGNMSTSQRALLLAADIGTLFNISSLPTQAASDPMPLYLEGYSETITAVSHTMTANTTPGTVYQNVFIWDDPVKGVWDAGNIWAY